MHTLIILDVRNVDYRGMTKLVNQLTDMMYDIQEEGEEPVVTIQNESLSNYFISKNILFCSSRVSHLKKSIIIKSLLKKIISVLQPYCSATESSALNSKTIWQRSALLSHNP